jgi:Phosphatidylinositol-4-phosphate 5-Kinase
LLTCKQYGLIKRIEHFWKGLRDNSSQISPVPPQTYGDRFINFVTGITMTKEEAARRQTHDSIRSEALSAVVRSRHNSRGQQLGNGIDGTHSQSHSRQTGSQGRDRLGIPDHPGDREKSPPGSPVAVEKTMQKAQTQTNKETSGGKDGRRRSEEEKPQRTLLAAEDGKANALLPVVSEENLDERKGSTASSRSIRIDGQACRSPSPMAKGDNEGIRMVSASTMRDSDEDHMRDPQQSHNQANRDGDIDVDGSRDRRDEDMNQEWDEKQIENERERGRSKPPRLDSGLLPKISPIEERAGWMMNNMDPEKR